MQADNGVAIMVVVLVLLMERCVGRMGLTNAEVWLCGGRCQAGQ